MGSRHDYALKGMLFAFLAQVRVCLIVIGKGTSSKMEMDFFFIVLTHFSCKAMSTMTTKQHSCWCLVIKRKIQHVRADFAFLTVVKIEIFIA